MKRNLTCLLAVIVLTGLWLRPADAGHYGTRVKLFAHRGYCLHKPENSLGALQAARRLGLFGSEIDLRTTRDGVLVLLHDETLQRTTSGRGKVADHAWSQLRSLRLKDRSHNPILHRIPSLKQVLDLVHPWNGFHLVLDLKQVDVQKAAQMIADRGMQERVTFFIAGPQKVAQVHAIREMDPRLRISLDLLCWWRIEGVASFAARALKAQTLFASEWFFPRRGFGEAKKSGAEVWVYLWGRHDLQARAQRAIEMGASGISCDRPDQLLPLASKRIAIKQP
ncbi:MAG: glycerophosphodiester phosphodiesterase family protein [Desulfarculaceae bacterium]